MFDASREFKYSVIYLNLYVGICVSFNYLLQPFICYIDHVLKFVAEYTLQIFTYYMK